MYSNISNNVDDEGHFVFNVHGDHDNDDDDVEPYW